MKREDSQTGQELAWKDFLERLQKMYAEGKNYEELASMLGTDRAVVWEWMNKGKGGKRVSFETMSFRLKSVGLNPEDYFSIKEEVAKSDFEYVPKAKTQLGAGSSLIIENGFNGEYAFRKKFIRSLGLINTNNLVLFDVIGDSMEPLIYDKDMVLVEKTEIKPRNGEIWAVWIGDEVLIKRIILNIGGGFIFSSENKRYSDINALGEQESFGFIGKVRWLSRIF